MMEDPLFLLSSAAAHVSRQDQDLSLPPVPATTPSASASAPTTTTTTTTAISDFRSSSPWPPSSHHSRLIPSSSRDNNNNNIDDYIFPDLPPPLPRPPSSSTPVPLGGSTDPAAFAYQPTPSSSSIGLPPPPRSRTGSPAFPSGLPPPPPLRVSSLPVRPYSSSSSSSPQTLRNDLPPVYPIPNQSSSSPASSATPVVSRSQHSSLPPPLRMSSPRFPPLLPGLPPPPSISNQRRSSTSMSGGANGGSGEAQSPLFSATKTVQTTTSSLRLSSHSGGGNGSRSTSGSPAYTYQNRLPPQAPPQTPATAPPFHHHNQSHNHYNGILPPPPGARESFSLSSSSPMPSSSLPRPRGSLLSSSSTITTPPTTATTTIGSSSSGLGLPSLDGGGHLSFSMPSRSSSSPHNLSRPLLNQSTSAFPSTSSSYPEPSLLKHHHLWPSSASSSTQPLSPSEMRPRIPSNGDGIDDDFNSEYEHRRRSSHPTIPPLPPPSNRSPSIDGRIPFEPQSRRREYSPIITTTSASSSHIPSPSSISYPSISSSATVPVHGSLPSPSFSTSQQPPPPPPSSFSLPPLPSSAMTTPPPPPSRQTQTHLDQHQLQGSSREVGEQQQQRQDLAGEREDEEQSGRGGGGSSQFQRQQQQQRHSLPRILSPSTSMIRCLCGFDKDDGYCVQCDRCQAWQHVHCFQLKDNEVGVNITFYCHLCNPDHWHSKGIDRLSATEVQRRKQEKTRGGKDKDSNMDGSGPSTTKGGRRRPATTTNGQNNSGVSSTGNGSSSVVASGGSVANGHGHTRPGSNSTETKQSNKKYSPPSKEIRIPGCDEPPRSQQINGNGQETLQNWMRTSLSETKGMITKMEEDVDMRFSSSVSGFAAAQEFRNQEVMAPLVDGTGRSEHRRQPHRTRGSLESTSTALDLSTTVLSLGGGDNSVLVASEEDCANGLSASTQLDHRPISRSASVSSSGTNPAPVMMASNAKPPLSAPQVVTTTKQKKQRRRSSLPPSNITTARSKRRSGSVTSEIRGVPSPSGTSDGLRNQEIMYQNISFPPTPSSGVQPLESPMPPRNTVPPEGGRGQQQQHQSGKPKRRRLNTHGASATGFTTRSKATAASSPVVEAGAPLRHTEPVLPPLRQWEIRDENDGGKGRSDEGFIDEPWMAEYTPVSHSLFQPDEEFLLRKAIDHSIEAQGHNCQHETDSEPYSPACKDLIKVVDAFPVRTASLSIREVRIPSRSLATTHSRYAPPPFGFPWEGISVFEGPPIYSVIATKAVSQDSFIMLHPGEIQSWKSWTEDGINAYCNGGALKPYVRGLRLPEASSVPILPDPASIVLDSRRRGSEARFVRTGCHPNATIKLLVQRRGATADHESRPRKSTDGVNEDKIEAAIYSTKDISEGEEIVLPWDWDDDHIVHTLPLLMGISPASPKSPSQPQFSSLDLFKSAELRVLTGKIAAVMTGLDGHPCACPIERDCPLAWMLKIGRCNWFPDVAESPSSKGKASQNVPRTYLDALKEAINWKPTDQRKGDRLSPPNLGSLIGLEKAWDRRHLPSTSEISPPEFPQTTDKSTPPPPLSSLPQNVDAAVQTDEMLEVLPQPTIIYPSREVVANLKRNNLKEVDSGPKVLQGSSSPISGRDTGKSIDIDMDVDEEGEEENVEVDGETEMEMEMEPGITMDSVVSEAPNYSQTRPWDLGSELSALTSEEPSSPPSPRESSLSELDDTGEIQVTRSIPRDKEPIGSATHNSARVLSVPDVDIESEEDEVVIRAPPRRQGIKRGSFAVQNSESESEESSVCPTVPSVVEDSTPPASVAPPSTSLEPAPGKITSLKAYLQRRPTKGPDSLSNDESCHISPPTVNGNRQKEETSGAKKTDSALEDALAAKIDVEEGEIAKQDDAQPSSATESEPGEISLDRPTNFVASPTPGFQPIDPGPPVSKPQDTSQLQCPTPKAQSEDDSFANITSPTSNSEARLPATEDSPPATQESSFGKLSLLLPACKITEAPNHLASDFPNNTSPQVSPNNTKEETNSGETSATAEISPPFCIPDTAKRKQSDALLPAAGPAPKKRITLSDYRERQMAGANTPSDYFRSGFPESSVTTHTLSSAEAPLASSPKQHSNKSVDLGISLVSGPLSPPQPAYKRSLSPPLLKSPSSKQPVSPTRSNLKSNLSPLPPISLKPPLEPPKRPGFSLGLSGDLPSFKRQRFDSMPNSDKRVPPQPIAPADGRATSSVLGHAIPPDPPTRPRNEPAVRSGTPPSRVPSLSERISGFDASPKAPPTAPRSWGHPPTRPSGGLPPSPGSSSYPRRLPPPRGRGGDPRHPRSQPPSFGLGPGDRWHPADGPSRGWRGGVSRGWRRR